MKKKEMATLMLKMAELSAGLRIDSASLWLHYQPVETQKMKEYVKAKKENKKLA